MQEGPPWLASPETRSIWVSVITGECLAAGAVYVKERDEHDGVSFMKKK